jgi:signal transduction histidine kinase
MKRVGLQSPQPINLNQLLSSVISAINPRLQESEATVRFSSLPMVWGQELELKRLFINLLTNALKYRREGIPGHVELVAEARGDEFVIAIKDNGIGFDTLDALEIFKPFKRLKQDFASGTGLGLAIAKAIVERHGGRIWATSDGVTGATFFFTLQRADQEERSVKAHA